MSEPAESHETQRPMNMCECTMHRHLSPYLYVVSKVSACVHSCYGLKWQSTGLASDTMWHGTHFPLLHLQLPKWKRTRRQSRKGSRWDKPVSLGHILESGITLAVWRYSQNTLSSLQHLIKGLLIFSWWSQPSQHLAADTPLFLHHTTLSRNTQVGFKQTNLPTKFPVPYEPSKKKKVSFKCPCIKPEEGGIKKIWRLRETLFEWKDFSQWPFVASTGKSRQSSADQWKKHCSSSLWWAPADSSSAYQQTERSTALLRWLESEPKPGNAVQAWAIDHVKKTGQLSDRRGSSQTLEAGRLKRWREGNPGSLIRGLFLVLPDFPSPSVAMPLTCLSLARPLLVQLLLLPPHNNRNLQK